MSLAIFDLDNTLIGGDSDYLWGEFLCDEGIISDRQSFEKKNDYFYQQYELGSLDIYAWAEFSFEILSHYSINELEAFHVKFMAQKIEPIFLEKAKIALIATKKMEIQCLLLRLQILLLQRLLLKDMELII